MTTSGERMEMPPLEAAVGLALEGKSGVLELLREGVRTRIYMSSGRVLFAQSNLKRFQPQAWLASHGIGAEPLSSTPVLGSGGTRSIAKALSGGDADQAKQVEEHLQARLSTIILEALAWTEAEMTFTPGSPSLSGESLVESSTRDLLGKAAAATAEPRRAALLKRIGVSRSAAPPEPATVRAAPEPEPDRASKLAAISQTDPEIRLLLERYEQTRGLNLYELLGVSRTADEHTIRDAYYGLARRYHPDALRGRAALLLRAEADRYFAGVTEAYNTLTRPRLRSDYDENLKILDRPSAGGTGLDAPKLARQNYQEAQRALTQEKLHDAIQFLENAVSLDPSRPEYRRDLGILQMRNPRWQKSAEESLKQALDLNPMDPITLAHLGVLYARNGLNQRARDAFRQALEWDAEQEVALAGLANLVHAPGEAPEKGGILKGLFKRG